jgi:hypothetical protein
MSPLVALFCRRELSNECLVLGVQRTWSGHSELDVPDPERHFATVNYRIAKGSFDHIGGGEE